MMPESETPAEENVAAAAGEPGPVAAPAVQSTQRTPASAGTPVAGEERYDYERTTIVFVAQLRPVREAGHPREVVLSVNNGVGNINDFPLMRILTEDDDLVAAAIEMLEQLQQELPERKARFLAKRTYYRPAPTPTAAPVSKAPARPDKASPAPAGSTAVKSTPPPPPVPATSKPIPKQELAMEGLFDGL
jgi:hypothetical protein